MRTKIFKKPRYHWLKNFLVLFSSYLEPHSLASRAKWIESFRRGFSRWWQSTHQYYLSQERGSHRISHTHSRAFWGAGAVLIGLFLRLLLPVVAWGPGRNWKSFTLIIFLYMRWGTVRWIRRAEALGVRVFLFPGSARSSVPESPPL